MNDKYKQISLGLSGSDRELLQSSQRYWLKFRDGYCSEYDPKNGGQGQEAAIDFLSCKTRLSNARTFEMQALVDDGGSDIYESALAKISALYAKSSVDTIKKEIISAGKGDDYFDLYARKNCELSAIISKEPEDNCLSRVYFMGK